MAPCSAARVVLPFALLCLRMRGLCGGGARRGHEWKWNRRFFLEKEKKRQTNVVCPVYFGEFDAFFFPTRETGEFDASLSNDEMCGLNDYRV